MPIVHGSDERPPFRESATPLNSDDAAVEAALLHGYKLEQKFDVPAGLRFILEQVGATTVVAIHPNTRATKARYVDSCNLSAVADWARGANSDGSNLYFQVNEPKQGLNKKAKKDDIIKVRAAAFADIDVKDSRSHRDVIAAIKALPRPSMVIFSGGGCQPIWLLPEPMPASGAVIAQAETLGERVAAMAGGDAVQNVDRILRLPFTVN